MLLELRALLTSQPFTDEAMYINLTTVRWWCTRADRCGVDGPCWSWPLRKNKER